MTNDRTKQEAGNSGSRPFSPIYNNFQHLLDNNQGVFRLFRKAKNPGMYQAVWQSRQAEVDTLKERLIQSEGQIGEKEKVLTHLSLEWEKNEMKWFEEFNSQRQNITYLEEMLKEAQSQIQKLTHDLKEQKEGYVQEIQKIKDNHMREKAALKKDLLLQKEETEKFRILTRSQERVIKMNSHKDHKFEDEIRKLETHLNLSQHALIKLDSEYEHSHVEIQNLKNRVYELENQLDESEKYNKEYKRINHRMENELYRVTTELENIQSFMN